METFIKFIAWYFTVSALLRLTNILLRKCPHTEKRTAFVDSLAVAEYTVLAAIAWTILP